MLQKTMNDYWDQLHEEFPEIPMHDLKVICNTGWKTMFMCNYKGADTLIQANKFFFYCGNLMKDSLSYCKYYIRKLQTKIRMLYEKNQLEWDGYYYFALNQQQYNDYLAQIHKRGRPKKYFVFYNIKAYKWYDECRVAEHAKVAIFRMSAFEAPRTRRYFKELKTDKAEFLYEQKPLTMKQILPTNYKYKF